MYNFIPFRQYLTKNCVRINVNIVIWQQFDKEKGFGTKFIWKKYTIQYVAPRTSTRQDQSFPNVLEYYNKYFTCGITSNP